jgi:methionine synthase II (cobalamin-independent)
MKPESFGFEDIVSVMNKIMEMLSKASANVIQLRDPKL